jgi:hypothetical protein
VKVTLDGMLSAITTWGDQEEVAPVTEGVQALMDTGFSLWSAWDSVVNPQPSIRDSLHNDMVQLQVRACTPAVLCCAVLRCAVLRCAALCCAVLRCAALCCAVLRCAALCCAVLCCAVLCCAVLRCAVLCCAVLCCAVLCCAVLRCAVLRCAVLCCAVLCCAVQHMAWRRPACSPLLVASSLPVPCPTLPALRRPPLYPLCPPLCC